MIYKDKNICSKKGRVQKIDTRTFYTLQLNTLVNFFIVITINYSANLTYCLLTE